MYKLEPLLCNMYVSLVITVVSSFSDMSCVSRLIPKTVIVNGPVVAANAMLVNTLKGDRIVEQYHVNKYYIKPTRRRVQSEYIRCNRLYRREMGKKVRFVMSQNKPLPPL